MRRDSLAAISLVAPWRVPATAVRRRRVGRSGADPLATSSSPRRDLASTWPADGPRRLWRRPLGDGFSAIVTDGATLYTLYRDGSHDVVIALDAATGTDAMGVAVRGAVQRHVLAAARPGAAGRRRSSTATGDHRQRRRPDERVRSAHRHAAVDVRPGGAARPDAVRACGYSSSPLAYKDRIITTAGGSRRGVVSLEAATGRVVWQTQDFDNGYSSPLLIDLDGRPEVVVFTFGDVAGLDPDTGALEWRVAHPAEFGVNVATPVWGDDHRAVRLVGLQRRQPRMLRLDGRDGAVAVEERWSSKRVRIHFGNAVRLGSRVYASNGDFGAAPLAAIDVATGEIVWRDRSVARSTLIGAGGRLLLLDEDGTLALATPGESGWPCTPKRRCWKARRGPADTERHDALRPQPARHSCAGSGKPRQQPLTPAPSVWWNRANRYCGGTLVAALPVEAPPTSFHAVLCAVMPPGAAPDHRVAVGVPMASLPQITAVPHDCGSVQTTLLPQMTALAFAQVRCEPQMTALPHAVWLTAAVLPQMTALPQITACSHDMYSPPIAVHGSGCGREPVARLIGADVSTTRASVHRAGAVQRAGALAQRVVLEPEVVADRKGRVLQHRLDRIGSERRMCSGYAVRLALEHQRHHAGADRRRHAGAAQADVVRIRGAKLRVVLVDRALSWRRRR